MLAVLTLLGVVLIVAVQTMVDAASEYTKQVTGLTKEGFAWLTAHNINIDQARITADLEGRLPGVISETAGTVSAIMSHGLLVAFFVVFLLVGRHEHYRRNDIYSDIEGTIRGYITTATADLGDDERACRIGAVGARVAHGVAVCVSRVSIVLHPEYWVDHCDACCRYRSRSRSFTTTRR